MASYAFVTLWRLEAPIEPVYDAIADSLRWPEWWPTVTAVEQIRDGDPETGVGNVRRYTFKGSLPYTLSFDLEVERLERPTSLAGRARGELEGTGVWTLSEEPGGVTVARYDWNVRTTRWWMNLLAPLARPVFKANHDNVMNAGAKGICSLLGGVNGTCAWVSDGSERRTAEPA
jgi:polyketide cyclase/dehydrase/lipid transport protein